MINMSETDDIKKKYIKKADPNRLPREPLGQNLQADINKVDAITRRISDKQAPTSELNRLRTSVVRLLSVIDNNDQLHL